MNKYSQGNGAVYTLLGIGAIGAVVFLFWFFPTYNVWVKEQSGRAQLAEAEFSKQTKIEEGKANLEAQKLNAQAEVERAKGASEAMKIESGNLTENYIRYLWVQQQDNLGDKTVIYLPTENGLPITESQRLK